MTKKNILFVFAFCFGVCSLIVIPGSQSLPSSQYLQSRDIVKYHNFQENILSLSNFQTFIISQAKAAKQFLNDKLWILENVSIIKTHDTPNVILALPQANPLLSEVTDHQSGEVMNFNSSIDWKVSISLSNSELNEENSSISLRGLDNKKTAKTK